MKDGNELGVIDVYEYVEIEVGSAWKQVLLVSGEVTNLCFILTIKMTISF